MNRVRPPKKFVPTPYEYHQELELTIENLTNLGMGVARDNGWVIFVPYVIPGEKVRARIYRNDKSSSHADLIEVLEASPKRIEPACELFGQCGGCQYQHMTYEEQLKIKTQQVGELLKHMAGIEHPVLPAIGSPREWNYRSKITPHFDKPKNGKIDAIGFQRAFTRNRLLDIPQCPIAMEEINEALPKIRKEVRHMATTFRKGVTLLMRATEGRVERNNKAVASEKVGELEFNFLAGDFFQNNPFILEAFTGYAAAEANPSGDLKYLVDAYCGSGLFALSLAKNFEQVYGVEVSETSADWARSNARTNKIENAEFMAASAEAIFEKLTISGSESAVVIDPPRKGCSEEFLDQLFAFSPQRVVYVSCNPATQVRDLEFFEKAGYEIDKIQPFDLFPQTKHLECVVTLKKA